MKTVWTLIGLLCLILAMGCETPYTGHLGPEDFNGWINAEGQDFVCIYNGFDQICIKTIPGRDGKDGKDGKDGQTLIAVREVPVEVIVEKIIETVVIEEVVKEIPVEIVTERVITEFIDREVPIEIFIDRVIEVTKEVFIEKIVIVEVPVEVIKEIPCIIAEIPGDTFDFGEGPVQLIALKKICDLDIDVIEVIREVPVETIVEVEKIVEVEVIREVPVETIVEVIKTVYIEVPPEPVPISVTAGAIYTEQGYHNPPAGFHAHAFTHTHDGATHTHRIIHPDGEKDDWVREHDGFSGLAHD